MRVAGVVAGLLLFSFLACSSNACSTNTDGDNPCTLLACGPEVVIEFAGQGDGSYVAEVVVDGTTSSCAARIEGGVQTGSPCAGPGFILNLPVGEQPGRVLVSSAVAKSITVRISREGQVLHDRTFAPSYGTAPGPNGPDCEPRQCSVAKLTLP